jgi:hypothetical protein
MHLLNIIVSSIILALVAGFAGLCILKPEMVVEWEKKQSKKSIWFQLNPFLFRSWYPTYLRCMGIVGLIFVALSVMVIAGHGF